jgi:CheY-like chemotaxis protein
LGKDRAPGRYAVIMVRDNGVGMSQEVQERMFDPFYSTKRSGSGLGLAATLGILNSHLGAIQVHSAEGVGTTIEVLLPVSVSKPTPDHVKAIPDTNHVGSGIVLLVDDDAGARSAVRRILTRAGYDVREAENGADALTMIDVLETPPRCLVLDLSMPIMGGDECLRILRAQGNTVPVLMSSGYDADDVAGHLVQTGSVHFLQKPYTAQALLNAVGELVGHG